ncbi:hypothetical protein P731_15155 [Listeria monocytogenes SHL014]|nr:hypothetical protein P731_15155 [Listeria monocytogenes SHL014]
MLGTPLPVWEQGSLLGREALGQWSTRRAGVLLQPDQACKETAFDRPW